MPRGNEALVPAERIAQAILLLRGQKVLLDTDLAELYGVTTKRFNEQVRRNLERFPGDFMFQLTQAEWDALRSQFATLKTGRGQHRKYLLRLHRTRRHHGSDDPEQPQRHRSVGLRGTRLRAGWLGMSVGRHRRHG